MYLFTLKKGWLELFNSFNLNHFTSKYKNFNIKSTKLLHDLDFDSLKIISKDVDIIVHLAAVKKIGEKQKNQNKESVEEGEKVPFQNISCQSAHIGFIRLSTRRYGKTEWDYNIRSTFKF